ncbi:AAA family ATPase [uncultured Microbacterium sp.]|uniref:AAA family ATPase n=1 Tax=uncultured Microbacterium sp. TaxID=191216 RepID=UPI00261ADF79|nr:AAA family ATPase [uncultured Microbacterium sp.]
MRIVVSGTHASGKSTLISDFALGHPGFTVLPDPFELLDEASDAPGAAMISAQLRLSAERLREETAADLIAERGPIDFLAYLLALADLTGDDFPDGYLERMTALTADALRTVDLLVVLPLNDRDVIEVGAEEHPALRTAMDGILGELIDDPDIVPAGVRVVEITGDPRTRRELLEQAL